MRYLEEKTSTFLIEKLPCFEEKNVPNVREKCPEFFNRKIAEKYVPSVLIIYSSFEWKNLHKI